MFFWAWNNIIFVGTLERQRLYESKKSFLSLLGLGKGLSVGVIFQSRKQSSPIAWEEWTSSGLICDGWLNANLATLPSAPQRIQNATAYSGTGALSPWKCWKLGTSPPWFNWNCRQLRMGAWRNFLRRDQLRMDLSWVIGSCIRQTRT